VVINKYRLSDYASSLDFIHRGVDKFD
jgi:hypothetical protein